MSELLTIADAAGELGVSETTLKRRIRGGALAAFVDGRVVRVRRSDLERYVAARMRLWQPAAEASASAGRELAGGARLWD